MPAPSRTQICYNLSSCTRNHSVTAAERDSAAESPCSSTSGSVVTVVPTATASPISASRSATQRPQSRHCPKHRPRRRSRRTCSASWTSACSTQLPMQAMQCQLPSRRRQSPTCWRAAISSAAPRLARERPPRSCSRSSTSCWGERGMGNGEQGRGNRKRGIRGRWCCRPQENSRRRPQRTPPPSRSTRACPSPSCSAASRSSRR